jgi:hypothetical protein
MSEHDFDLTARAWLDDGPTRMSDRAVLSTLDEIHVTRQRRAVWPAWRATPAKNVARVAIAAVLVVGVGFLAINLVPRQPSGSSVGGPSPSPSPDGSSVGGSSPSLSPARAARLFSLTTTFISPTYGYSFMFHDRGGLTPATELWDPANQPMSANWDNRFDAVETGSGAYLQSASTPVPDGVLIDDWVDEYVTPRAAGGCNKPRSQQAEITIDGQPGRIAECHGQMQATVVAGGRLYLFAMVHSRPDARAFFDAWIFTVDLTPETAVDVPAFTETFVSPTYAYSFGYPRGIITPATERWDPDDETVDFADRFDVVETGLAAYLESASTAIPDGVAIDDWVDEYVTVLGPEGCPVPRRQQADITIDGQPGKIADCGNGIEATVVAGGRLYLFKLGHDRSDGRAFFDTWIATVDLTPETAAPRPSGDGEATASPSEAP